MANDAKLGLVLGVALVVLIGIVYSRRDVPAGGGQALPPASSLPAAATSSGAADVPPVAVTGE